MKIITNSYELVRLPILLLVILVCSNAVDPNLGLDLAINYDRLYFHSHGELQQLCTGLGIQSQTWSSQDQLQDIFGSGTDDAYGSLDLIHNKSTVLKLLRGFAKIETMIFLENLISKKKKFILEIHSMPAYVIISAGEINFIISWMLPQL